MVIREAIQLLSSAGLVKVRHGRRTAVLPSEEWNVLDPLVFEAFRATDKAGQLLSDLYVVRNLLEPPAARWTAENATDEDVETITQLVQEIADAGQAGDAEAMLDADHRFHSAIIEIAGANAVLYAIFRSLQALMAGSWSMPLDGAELSELEAQHAAIAQAVAQGDCEAAEKSMRTHIAWAAQTDLHTKSSQ